MISSFSKLIELDGLLFEYVVIFQRLAFIDYLIPWINCLAKGGVIWFFILLYLAAFHSLKGRKIFFLGSISMLLAYGLTWALKLLIHRPRPFSVADNILPLVNLLSEQPPGYSFPSEQTSLAFAATAVLLANTGNKYFKTLILLLALLIAYSRIYEGVCYPLDVIGGACLGLLSAKYVMGKMKIKRRVRRNKYTVTAKESFQDEMTGPI